MLKLKNTNFSKYLKNQIKSQIINVNEHNFNNYILFD
jgi:hypothetical protein